MKIIIKESLEDFKDDYLDYNEDKYYRVDTFKDFKKYAHKDKHHQNIDAITSNYQQLLKDLEKNNIYINSEFKDIDDSDLDKENNYYILSYKFINNIVEQLGYKANPIRTYKDDIIKYKGKNISSIEFENMIDDKSNEFHWLSKCKFRNAGIEISKPLMGIYSDFTMKNASWINGVWKPKPTSENIFINGIWQNGTWTSGKFERSKWIDGIWENGDFENGNIWYKGTFNDGTIFNSIWKNGIFNGGTLNRSRWENGLFNGGSFNNSEWLDGIWLLNNSKKSKSENSIVKHVKYKFENDEKEYSFEEIFNSLKLLTNMMDILHVTSGIYSDYIYMANKKILISTIQNRIKELS